MSIESLSRKKVYILALVLDIIISSVRFNQFPNKGTSFQVLFFILGFIAIAIFWEVLLRTGDILNKYLPVNSRPEVRIICQVLLSFIFTSTLGAAISIIAIFYYDIKPEERFNPATHLFNLLVATIFNLAYFGNHYFIEWKKNLVRSEGLQREQAEVRYNALRNQLNPHFLFNALTSLNSLIFENQQLASDFLKQLSKVYRYTLQNKSNEVVSLKNEMEFINHYISLLETRFGIAIQFNIDIKNKYLDKRIVPVTTQMLIENAVKHNIIAPSSPLKISITTEGEFLIVTNNVNRKSQIETSNKLGLDNLKGLYQYLSLVSIEIIETESQFTIKIPLI